MYIPQNMVARAFKFGYANARAKSMKQSLLSPKELTAMVEAKDVKEIFSILEKTEYRNDLISTSLGERTIADKIELVTTKNFSRTLKRVRKIAPKEHREKIIQIFEKYDIENIKTIIISKHINEPKEKIENYIMETGVLSRGALNRLMDAKSVKDVIAELGGTVYALVLEKKFKQYEKDKEIAQLIAALDEYYYKKLPRILKDMEDERIMLGMLKSLADVKNISNILRAKKTSMKDEKIIEMIIPQGNIPKERLISAAQTKNVEDAMRVFEKTHKIGKAIDAYKKNGSLIPLEIELEKNVAKKSLKVLSNSVLSLGAVAGFLFLKEEEMANIRKIVRAKEFNLSSDRIKEMIVTV